MKRKKNELYFRCKEKNFYLKSVYYRNRSVGTNVIDNLVTTSLQFKNVILILCTENQISANVYDLIDNLNVLIYISSECDLIQKIKSFIR